MENQTAEPQEKVVTTRQFLKSLKNKLAILRVTYQRRGGPNTEYGMYEGFCTDDSYFSMANDTNSHTIITVEDVIEIRSVPLPCIAAFLNDQENLRDHQEAVRSKFMQSCPVVHSNKPE